MKKIEELTDFELNVICHTLNFKAEILEKKDLFLDKIKGVFDGDIVLVSASASDIILVADFLRKRGYELKLSWSRLRIFEDDKGHGYYFNNGDISEERKKWIEKDGMYIEERESGFCAFYK